MQYRTALVTWASKGIGAATAEALVNEGLTVYALARDKAVLESVADKLGPRLLPLAADVRDHAAVAGKLAGQEIDVLVNNAGGLASVKPLH